VVKKKQDLEGVLENNKKNQPYILVWKYQKLYKEKYGKDIVVNKFQRKSAMQDVIDSIGYDRAMELLDYYFKLDRSNHTLLFFLWNFDRLDLAEKEISRDKEKEKCLEKRRRS
jgi:hypothetical protein